MRRVFFISIFLLYILHAADAQTKIIDSLQQRIYSAHNPQSKLQAILKLCEEYRSLQRDTLDYYSRVAMEMAAKIGDARSKDLAQFALANSHFRWGWMDSALYVIEPLFINNTVENPATRDFYFKLARQKAMYYGNKSRYPEALSLLHQLVSEADKYSDSLTMGANLNSIGSISLEKKEPYVALRWFKRAHAVTSSHPKFDPILAAIYSNMADAFNQINKTDSAITYIEKGIQLFRKTQNLMNLAHVLQKKSTIFLHAKKLPEAEAALKEMISVRQQMNDGSMWVDDNLALVDFYLETNQVDKAITVCLQALYPVTSPDGNETVSFTRSIHLRLSYHEALARCYAVAGNKKLENETLRKIESIKDSINQIEAAAKDSIYQAQALADMKAKYESQKRENTILQQEFSISRKNYWIGGIIIFLLFAAILSWVLFNGYQKRQKIKTELLVEKEKQSANEAVKQAEENERKRIAADLHDNLGAYAASIASNLDIIKGEVPEAPTTGTAMELLNENSQAMVAQLSDTIWALNKQTLSLTAISDRIKIFVKRIQPNHTGIAMDVIEKLEDDIQMPPTQAFHIFQIVQEAVTNVIKHSEATRLTITIADDKGGRIAIQDNGKGMQEKDGSKRGGGNGLVSMQKRAEAAGWEIQWQPVTPSGTEVIIQATAN